MPQNRASLPKDILYSAYRFSADHLAPNGEPKHIFGTCFYVRAGAETFLVTNKHNFDLSHSHRKYIGYRISGMTIVGSFGIGQYAECDFAEQTVYFALPANNEEDIVAFNLTDIPFRFKRKRKPGEDPKTVTTSLSPLAIDIDMLATEQDLRELNPGDGIAFPSYPELFDINGIRPVMRTGTIASDPENDYQSRQQEPGRRIAYEAQSTQGSSGSPVFAITEASQLVLIGINSGHLLRQPALCATRLELPTARRMG
jgi:hypothetical protein